MSAKSGSTINYDPGDQPTGPITVKPQTILDYLATAMTFNELNCLYKDKFTVLTLFRILPALSKQYVMRLVPLPVNTPISAETILSWHHSFSIFGTMHPINTTNQLQLNAMRQAIATGGASTATAASKHFSKKQFQRIKYHNIINLDSIKCLFFLKILIRDREKNAEVRRKADAQARRHAELMARMENEYANADDMMMGDDGMMGGQDQNQFHNMVEDEEFVDRNMVWYTLNPHFHRSLLLALATTNPLDHHLAPYILPPEKLVTNQNSTHSTTAPFNNFLRSPTFGRDVEDTDGKKLITNNTLFPDSSNSNKPEPEMNNITSLIAGTTPQNPTTNPQTQDFDYFLLHCRAEDKKLGALQKAVASASCIPENLFASTAPMFAQQTSYQQQQQQYSAPITTFNGMNEQQYMVTDDPLNIPGLGPIIQPSVHPPGLGLFSPQQHLSHPTTGKTVAEHEKQEKLKRQQEKYIHDSIILTTDSTILGSNGNGVNFYDIKIPHVFSGKLSLLLNNNSPNEHTLESPQNHTNVATTQQLQFPSLSPQFLYNYSIDQINNISMVMIGLLPFDYPQTPGGIEKKNNALYIPSKFLVKLLMKNNLVFKDTSHKWVCQSTPEGLSYVLKTPQERVWFLLLLYFDMIRIETQKMKLLLANLKQRKSIQQHHGQGKMLSVLSDSDDDTSSADSDDGSSSDDDAALIRKRKEAKKKKKEKQQQLDNAFVFPQIEPCFKLNTIPSLNNVFQFLFHLTFSTIGTCFPIIQEKVIVNNETNTQITQIHYTVNNEQYIILLHLAEFGLLYPLYASSVPSFDNILLNDYNKLNYNLIQSKEKEYTTDVGKINPKTVSAIIKKRDGIIGFYPTQLLIALSNSLRTTMSSKILKQIKLQQQLQQMELFRNKTTQKGFAPAGQDDDEEEEDPEDAYYNAMIEHDVSFFVNYSINENDIPHTGNDFANDGDDFGEDDDDGFDDEINKLKTDGNDNEHMTITQEMYHNLYRNDHLYINQLPKDEGNNNNNNNKNDKDKKSGKKEEVIEEDYKLKEHFLIIETTLKIYAFTTNPLYIAIMSNFVEFTYKLPNIVIGHITRKSIQQGIKTGLKIDDIIKWLTIHSHERMILNAMGYDYSNIKQHKQLTTALNATNNYKLNRDHILPTNVLRQLKIWSEEQNRFITIDCSKIDCTTINQYNQIMEICLAEEFAQKVLMYYAEIIQSEQLLLIYNNKEFSSDDNSSSGDYEAAQYRIKQLENIINQPNPTLRIHRSQFEPEQQDLIDKINLEPKFVLYYDASGGRNGDRYTIIIHRQYSPGVIARRRAGGNAPRQ